MIVHKMINPNNKVQNIKNIILVSSGKGGVGKSTVSLHLALFLKKLGLQIGILDADIYGPSLPILLQEPDYKLDVMNGSFVPLEKYGVQAVSFGFLIDPKKAAIWRGAIVVKALKQLLFDTLWKELDILIIDMPPGTGDIHLSIAQSFPVTANILVTTPHVLSLNDVYRSIEMYIRLNIPHLGFIQNMAYYVCGKCNSKDYIFGNEIGDLLHKEYNLNDLGQIPCINPSLENAAHEEFYKKIAHSVLLEISKLPKAMKTIIPPVVSI